ncbi:MAG: TIGR00725 family protein [Thermoplasmata archaeon]
MVNVSVVGGSQVSDEICDIAIEVGRLLAKRGATVFCGGLDGVMKCVSKGVKMGGGISVGILPGYSTDEGNEYLTIKVPTGMGYARNFLVVRAGDVVIAIDGSTGTLSEASFAIAEGKDVVAIGDIVINPKKEKEGKFFKAKTPKEAVDLAFSRLGK